MKSFTAKFKIFLALVVLATAQLSYGLPEETEYLGVIARAGYYDDGAWGSFPVGFNFTFFGNSYTEFYVTSNGLVMFGSGSTRYINTDIPSPFNPNNYIAPFWDDLVIHSTGDIMYQTIGTAPNRKLIIQFTNMSFWNSPVLLGTFQVILFEGSNNIQVQYRSIVDLKSERASGNSATIGLENSNGSGGVVCSYNTAGYVESEKAILFTPSGSTYTFDDHALYEGVLLQDVIPRAGTPTLVSPAYNSTVGEDVTFNWEAASNADNYFVVISLNSDLSSPIHTSADLTELSYSYTLAADQTYFWSAYAKNSVGSVSWSEIWMFTTSPYPPLLSVPRTIYLEQGQQRTITLQFTGGDAGAKTATVSSLPAEGVLYQYNGGMPGPEITSVPEDVTDGSFRVIYQASGNSGNDLGNFTFHFSDGTGTSADETIKVNISPPGIPNFLYASKETDRVEITFDREMADPTGKHLEFSVQDDGVAVTPVACSLKAGDPATIVVLVSPGLDTDHTITVAYTKGTITAASSGALESFDFQLAGKLAQVINFDPIPDKTYGDPDFGLTATASSGLGVTFGTSNSVVVSVSGSTASVHNAGEVLISASQPGNATYASASFQQHLTVNKATATVTLSDMDQEYTGSGIQVTVSSVPSGLTTKVTYDGSYVLPVDIGQYEVIAAIEDDNYQGTASGTLTISDLTAPVPDQPVLPDLVDECEVTPVAPTATDNYAGTITGTTATSFPVIVQGTTVITWTYDDGNGNTVTQTQNVIIEDVTAPDVPVLEDLTGECSVTAVAPTTTDACAGTITGTTTDPLTYSSQGSYVINWTFDDQNGNSVQATQNVIVEDLTAPAFNCPGDVVTCDGNAGELGLSDVSDNCNTPTVTYELSGATIASGTGDASLETFSEGITTVTYTIEDGNGNTGVCSFTVDYQPVGEIVVSISGETLTVETAGTYQWINCEDHSVIEGETANSFTPEITGEYAVIVTLGACSDTSQCILVEIAGTGMAGDLHTFRIYPVPAHEQLILEMDAEHSHATIRIINAGGQVVAKGEMERLLKTSFDIGDFDPGLYLMHIESDQMNSIIRFIKE